LPRRTWLALLCALSLGWAVLSLAAAQTASARKKPVTAKKSTAKKGSASKAPSKKKSSKKSKKGSWRTASQRQPTPERYKEIQEALAARGYLRNSPDGVWSPESVDALKRFQQDQNLEPTGKITSLSLIALGLGPKRDTQPPPPQ